MTVGQDYNDKTKEMRCGLDLPAGQIQLIDELVKAEKERMARAYARGGITATAPQDVVDRIVKLVVES